MLTLESASRELRRLPPLVQVGLVVLALAGIGDIAAHLDAAGHASHVDGHTTAEIAAHVAAFVGMVLILLGVVVDGVRHMSADRDRVRRTRKGVA